MVAMVTATIAYAFIVRRRKSYLQKGKALLKDGRQSEATDCFQRCIDVSPEMAAAFIKELKKNSVQVYSSCMLSW